MSPVLEFQFPIVLALLSTTGGGLIRDGIFLQRTPVMLIEPQYVLIPLAAMVVVSLFGSRPAASSATCWWGMCRSSSGPHTSEEREG